MPGHAAALTMLVAALLLAGCGDDDRATAVDAREANTVEIGDLRYRVTLFRQLNPRIPPDDAIYGRKAPDGEAVLAAFLRVCNLGKAPQTPTSEIHLEDAFGAVYEPVSPEEQNAFRYRPKPVPPDRCLPREGSASDAAFPGPALVFHVPFANLRERPFVLEIQGDGDDGGDAERRIELDL